MEITCSTLTVNPDGTKSYWLQPTPWSQNRFQPRITRMTRMADEDERLSDLIPSAKSAKSVVKKASPQLSLFNQ
jgi:hypothetical protein